jgi:hypothetical protein
MPVVDEVEKDHKVHKETEKVLGPQVKELDHARSELVKALVLFRSAFVRGAGIGEAGEGVPRSNDNVGPKHVCELDDPTGQVRAQVGPGRFIVVDGAKDGHNSKEDVLVDKCARQHRSVRVVARVGQFGQNFKGEEGGRALENACPSLWHVRE